MLKIQTKGIMIFSLFFLCTFFAMVKSAEATNHYVRQNSTGNGSGSDWTNAYGTLPATLTRGDTYYIADGNYSSYIFDDANSGSTIINIKKATLSDHGTEIDWSAVYGDGQAVFADHITFSANYYVFDGNGTHTIPSNNTADYGFRITNTSTVNHGGVIRLDPSSSYITVKYVHLYNTYGGKDGNYDTISLRMSPSGGTNLRSYVKIQNCFFENSGTDGIQANGTSYLLFERNYVKKCGLLYSPAGETDTHGQTVMMFYGTTHYVVFRYNIWEANEGQGLISMGENANSTFDNIRFYGNVVFNKYGAIKTGTNPETAGFNTGGGIVGDSWSEGTTSNVYVYNNTIVNVGGEQKTYGSVTVDQMTAQFPVTSNATNAYSYNNFCYKCINTNYYGWDGYGYHASGGGDAMSGTSEQTGLASSIFANYTGNDFRLTGHIAAGLTLSSQSWWSGGAHAFFGTVDSAVDMYGNTRTNWDRGAFENVSGGGDTTPPAAPSGLGIN